MSGRKSKPDRAVRILAAGICLAVVLTGASAKAGDLAAFGPNSDFPDANLVMPFAAQGSRVTFLSLSNVGASAKGPAPIVAIWSFYDVSGELVVEVERDILGEGGTDLVDVTAVQPLPPDGSAPVNLSGRNGFVVISGDGEPRFIGNFTIANTASNAAFGASAIGLGVIGVLAPNAALLGTTFNPSTLGDNLLIVLAIDDLGAVPTSITGGAPPPGGTLFDLVVSLNGNQGDGLIAQTVAPIGGSGLFTTLQDLFPGETLNSSATISAFTEDEGITVVGYYGQALGPFGAGQNLRTELVAE
jgi:hypothetical protein